MGNNNKPRGIKSSNSYLCNTNRVISSVGTHGWLCQHVDPRHTAESGTVGIRASRFGGKVADWQQKLFERVVSSVGLERLLDRQEVAGSNPVQPTESTIE